MPRPRTGSAFPHGDHWDIQITLPDGSRSRPMCQPPEMSEARARDKARRLTELAKQGALPGVQPKRPRQGAAAPGETFAAWSDRWCADREARGLSAVDDDRGRLRKWVLPHFEGKPLADITRTDLERLVEKLDEQVRGGALEWKTARNVWGTVSKAFDDACHSKTLALRVLSENPCTGVRGPDRGAQKAKQYLYPKELLALVSCPSVPLRWRRIYALAAYVYMRAGELRALEWADVDFEGGVISITKSLTEKGVIKPTKTKETRKIPIEPSLFPLLRVLHAEGGQGRVLTVPQKKAAQMLRAHLGRAGIMRADLFAADATRKPLTFHDAGRATGITWMALRGDDPLRIQRRAGHADFDTTQIYIREAETLGRDVGAPFPPLPACLLNGAKGADPGGDSPGESPGTLRGVAIPKSSHLDTLRGGRDSNPHENVSERRASAGFRAPKVDGTAPKVNANPATSGGAGDSRAIPSTPPNARAAAVAKLAAVLGEVADDPDAAREVNEAIARLLRPAAPPAAEDAAVVDLGAERARRQRR